MNRLAFPSCALKFILFLDLSLYDDLCLVREAPRCFNLSKTMARQGRVEWAMCLEGHEKLEHSQ
jgi:hypothetical protein